MRESEKVQELPGVYPSKDDEINLRDVFLTLWAGKWLILSVALAFTIAGIAYALHKPNIYQSSVLLAPANEEGSLNGISGQLGGLASLAGINIGSGSSNQTVIAKEVLQSRAFLADFVKRHSLEVPLLGTSGWSEATKSWIYNSELYDSETGQWLTDESGTTFKPTDWELVNALKQEHISVSENKDNGMITLKVRSLSPVASQQWAEWLVADINEHMRRKDVAESNARISYLQEKLNDTNVAGMQQVFYQLIESETRTVMLANAQKEYVFETVDPAVIPEEKVAPKRGLIVALSVMLGTMLGVALVFAYFFMANGSRNITEKTNNHK
ncbi:Wzz/FepE/Etk N-terminal domain-containing protein [Marinobacter adhaerens]|uniref:Wzz/FepE/Etk N-terminal domain-containing protein n=1 Tax=Marinobacter adhaerens TaxID=1033846 RepID=UPI003C3E6570